MPELEMNPAAAKFISSLVKSLQILCNGQVEFNDCIELVGHINVKVDKVYKFDYIVDEQVSREGNDSSTTFLSNSYHSSPPIKPSSSSSSSSSQFKGLSTASQQHELRDCFEQTIPQRINTMLPETSYTTHIDSQRKQNNVMIKLEGDDDNDDCMVLPASPGDYEQVDSINAQENLSVAGPSSAISDSYETEYDVPVKQYSQAEKKRKIHDPDQDEPPESKAASGGSSKSSAGKRGASELVGKFAAYECSYCSVILTQYEDLTVHSKSCASPSCCMICLTCGEKLANKPEMRQHLKLAHSHKTFGCKFCDMMFLSSSGLLSHTKAKHKPDSKTLCQLCGQAFHNKANLEGHMNMHLGIRPFKCKRCGKSYGHSKSLITHEKMCKSIISGQKSSANRSPQIQMKHHHHHRLQSHLLSKTMAKAGHSSKKEEKKLQTAPAPSQTQTNLVYSEPYQSFERREEKGAVSVSPSGRNLTLIHNPSQPFSYNDSYPTTFSESPVGQQVVTLPTLNSTNASNVSMANAVYAHPTTSFVLPQVTTYGMYQQGLLPDQR